MPKPDSFGQESESEHAENKPLTNGDLMRRTPQALKGRLDEAIDLLEIRVAALKRYRRALKANAASLRRRRESQLPLTELQAVVRRRYQSLERPYGVMQSAAEECRISGRTLHRRLGKWRPWSE